MDSKYKLTVGLEIHAELVTKTKMFCNSLNDTEEKRPNHNVCPVCMGYPGTLPVINKEAVKSVLRLGTAVGGKLADYTEFDRKNYFYPDIPKGYQISQYKYPLVSGGEVAGVKLTRIHLEEDTAKSTHDQGDHSLVDFNRAGVPLVELVTEPVIHDAQSAGSFAREFQLLISPQYLNISNANMEKGEMRVEANISVSKSDELGTKVEVKNLNSFKSVEKAIKYEVERQIAILEKGEKVVMETRGWDEDKQETFSQRKKEESHDYRYFPDPDLPKLFISQIPEFSQENLSASLGELPWQKRERLVKEFGIKAADAEIYTRDLEWGKYFEEVAKSTGDKEIVQLASNYILSDLEKTIKTEDLIETMNMIKEGTISSRGAKDILKTVQEHGGKPKEIAETKNLTQISDEEVLKKWVLEVKSQSPDAPVQFLVGQVMKLSGGRANPIILQRLLD